MAQRAFCKGINYKFYLMDTLKYWGWLIMACLKSSLPKLDSRPYEWAGLLLKHLNLTQQKEAVSGNFSISFSKL